MKDLVLFTTRFFPHVDAAFLERLRQCDATAGDGRNGDDESYAVIEFASRNFYHTGSKHKKKIQIFSLWSR